MDVFMPKKDGVEATTEIRKFESENNLKPIPIIFVTGNHTKFERMKTENLKLDGFLCKPLEKDILL